ncbi:MAG: helix-turn-helix domain-containing protein [Actinomycetia bacterium]|nr:helix-turn-helix domain-containing protein [Actinomycetes bacterium]
MNDICTNTTDDRLSGALDRIRTRPAVDVDDVTSVMGVGRSTGYAAVKAGEWPSIKVMGRIRIPSAWVREQLMLTD